MLLTKNSGQAITLVLASLAAASVLAAGVMLQREYASRATKSDSQEIDIDSLVWQIDWTLKNACKKSLRLGSGDLSSLLAGRLPATLAQDDGSLIQAGAISHGMKITSLSSARFEDYGLQRDGTRCLVGSIDLGLARPAGTLGGPAARSFPISLAFDPQSGVLKACSGGPTQCTPPPRPLPSPKIPEKSSELPPFVHLLPAPPCFGPEIQQLAAYPDPLPVDEGITVDWKIRCGQLQKLRVLSGHAEQAFAAPVNAPLNLPPADKPTIIELTAGTGHEGERPVVKQVVVFPGIACAAEGSACDPGRPCCTGYCGESGTCSNPCTARGNLKLDQSSCFTRSSANGQDTACGLATPDHGYLTRGDTRKIDETTNLVTWFACDGEP